MVFEEPTSLSYRMYAIGNANRRRIYNLCLKEKLNISQIAAKINLSYKSTFQNIDILERAGLIEKEKQTTEKSNESFIKSVPLPKDKLLRQIYDELDKEDTDDKK